RGGGGIRAASGPQRDRRGGDSPGDGARPRRSEGRRPGALRARLRGVGEARVVIGGLARRYARALLELAREARTLDATGQELAGGAGAFEEPRPRAPG